MALVFFFICHVGARFRCCTAGLCHVSFFETLVYEEIHLVFWLKGYLCFLTSQSSVEDWTVLNCWKRTTWTFVRFTFYFIRLDILFRIPLLVKPMLSSSRPAHVVQGCANGRRAISNSQTLETLDRSQKWGKFYNLLWIPLHWFHVSH